MEEFDTQSFPYTVEADVLIMMSVKLMVDCHNYGLSMEEVWDHFTAFGLAGEA